VQPSNKVVHTNWLTIEYHRRQDHKLKRNLYPLSYYDIFIVWKRFCKNNSFVLLHSIVVLYFVIPQRLLGGHQRSGETRRLHFQTDFHPEEGGKSVLRNFGNHSSFGLVPLKNSMDCQSLRITSFQQSISSLHLNFISTHYPDTRWRNSFRNSVYKIPCE